jgi:hypothetical protein
LSLNSLNREDNEAHSLKLKPVDDGSKGKKELMTPDELAVKVEYPFNKNVYVVRGSRKSAAADGSINVVLLLGVSSLSIPVGILKFLMSTKVSGSTPFPRVCLRRSRLE